MDPFGPEVDGEVREGRVGLHPTSVPLGGLEDEVSDLVFLENPGRCEARRARAHDDHHALVVIRPAEGCLAWEEADTA